MMRLFYTTSDQRCDNPACGRYGKTAGIHALSCEECKRSLSPVHEVEWRVVAVAVVVSVLLLLGVGQAARFYFIRRAAVREAEIMTRAGAHLQAALRGATTEEVDGIVASVQTEFRLTDSQRQRLRANTRALISGLPRALGPEFKPRLEALLRTAYRDGVVSPEESSGLEAFARKHRLQPAAVQAFQNEIASRVQASNRNLSRGNLLLARNMVAEARGEFRQATESDPGSAIAWVDLGAAESTLGNRNEAQRCFDQALRLDPGNWLAHYNLGLLAARGGDREGALRHFDRALGSLPPSAGHQRRSLVHELLAEPALAELRRDPRFEELLGGSMGLVHAAEEARP
jgi:tetratricopeptide (TPR) repeat protein